MGLTERERNANRQIVRISVDIIVDIKVAIISVYTYVDKRVDIAHDRPEAHLRPAISRPLEHPNMTRPLRLGVLTPSSNTALEPLTSALAAAVPACSAHFSRFRVTEISLSQAALGQFDDSKILAAAELLADAKVDVIGWSGTAAGWRGFDTDRVLVQRIRERTGIVATTAVLALNELLTLGGITRLALVTPYTADVQERIVENYRRIGVEVVAERHLGISHNHDFALVEPQQLLELMRDDAAARPQAITTYCTNLRAAALAERVEVELGIPLLDTVSTTVWGQLRAAGADAAQVRGWGRLFGWR
jgi:maleate isomerase